MGVINPMFSITAVMPKEKLKLFCRNNHIIKLSLFGSALHSELKPDSDIDLLVEFDQKFIPGLFDIARMELQLSEMLKRKVDLRTPEDLSHYFRDEVLKEAVVHYEET
jgi:uncharacterized protein